MTGMTSTGEIRRDPRQVLHDALDALLDAAPAELPGPALADLLVAWRTLVDVLDGRALAMVPGWEGSGDWAQDGARSPGMWLVRETGMSKAAAGSFRKTAHDAARHPDVLASVSAGRMPVATCRELLGARKRDVAAEFDRDVAELVAVAETKTFEELHTHLLSWRLRMLEEAERNADERAPGPLDENDRVSLHTGFGGRGILDGDLGPESAALLANALDAELDTMRRNGELEGDVPSRPELNASALMNIVRRGMDAGTSHGRPRPSVVAITGLDALLRRASKDAAERDRVRSEIVGAGPVPDATIRKLLCDADLSLVITSDTGEPLWVGRNSRTATAAQWRALIARSGGTCEMPGCDAPHHRCQAHHIDEWEHGGPTDISNLVLLCHHNHQQVHHHRWKLVLDQGQLHVYRRDGTEIRARHHQRPPPATRAA